MKMRKLTCIAAAVMCLTLTGCGRSSVGIIGGADGPTSIIVSSEEGDGKMYKSIEQDMAYALMQTENCIILDVRTQAEYEEKHIKGAVCLPNEEIGGTEPELLPDKDQLILVYCRSGRRSKDASQKLAEMGYSNIMEFGGINSWQYETEPVK